MSSGPPAPAKTRGGAPSEGESWRCFVAVPITEYLRAALTDAVDGWRDDPEVADLRWTDPGGWHITLAFLGSMPAAQVGPMEATLAPAVTRLPRFELAGGGLGAFPSANRARVLWYGLTDPGRRLAELARLVRRGLALEEDRTQFRPHLTLARSRDRFGGPPLTEWLERQAAPSAQVPVEQVIMFRSRLGRGPARYEPLFSLPLGGDHG